MIESEKYLERMLVNRIKAINGLCLKLLCSHFTGLPDRMCLLPGGKIFFAEIKTTGFTPSPRQKWVKNKLSQLGFNVYIIDNSLLLKKLTGDDVSI